MGVDPRIDIDNDTLADACDQAASLNRLLAEFIQGVRDAVPDSADFADEHSKALLNAAAVCENLGNVAQTLREH